MIILTANYSTSKIVREWVEEELYENGWHKPFPISIIPVAKIRLKNEGR
jgi:hypothetical protein